MLTTRFTDGSPNWLDLGTPDLDAAERFYQGLLGWSFVSAGPEAGGYGMFQLDGRTAAGGMTVTPDQGPPGWNVYFRTPDADATAASVRESGGRVLFDPMDVFDRGRMAVFTDPDGVGFSVWQPGRTQGLDTAGERGALCWLELYTPRPGEGVDFYRSVFGWGTSTMPYPGGSGEYVMIHPAGEGPDAMFGGVVPLAGDPVDSEPYWLPYFAVEDCDASVARARELGGTVRMDTVEMADVGRFARLADPAGARFAVLQPFPPRE
jgi:uncharacterized protein